MSSSIPNPELIPHIGVPPLRFGMTHNDVRAQLGPPPEDSLTPYVWYYDENSIMLNFDEGGQLEFIELWWPTAVSPRYRDLRVFDIPAHDLIRTISRDAGPPRWRDFGNTVAFYSLDMGFTRPQSPHDDEPEDEYRNGKYWMTADLARAGYFREHDETMLSRYGEADLVGQCFPDGYEDRSKYLGNAHAVPFKE